MSRNRCPIENEVYIIVGIYLSGLYFCCCIFVLLLIFILVHLHIFCLFFSFYPTGPLCIYYGLHFRVFNGTPECDCVGLCVQSFLFIFQDSFFWWLILFYSNVGDLFLPYYISFHFILFLYQRSPLFFLLKQIRGRKGIDRVGGHVVRNWKEKEEGKL